MKPRFHKKRVTELEQLVNNIAEDENLRNWRRSDLIDCIVWQQELAVDERNRRGLLHLKIMDVLTADLH